MARGYKKPSSVKRKPVPRATAQRYGDPEDNEPKLKPSSLRFARSLDICRCPSCSITNEWLAKNVEDWK